MSLRATKAVWENSRAKNGARLVMLFLADRERQDGRTSWPSVAEIARRCGISDEKHVRKLLAELESMGELTIERVPGKPSAYALTPGSGTPSLYRPEVGGKSPPTSRGSNTPGSKRGEGVKHPGVSDPQGRGSFSPRVGGHTPPDPGVKQPRQYGYYGKDNGSTGKAQGAREGSPSGNECRGVSTTDREAAESALSVWSQADRGTPLLPQRNELRIVWAALEDIRDMDPIPTTAGSLPALSLVARAVQAKRGARVKFRSIKFALGCVKSQLDEWAGTGIGMENGPTAAGMTPAQLAALGGDE